MLFMSLVIALEPCFEPCILCRVGKLATSASGRLVQHNQLFQAAAGAARIG